MEKNKGKENRKRRQEEKLREREKESESLEEEVVLSIRTFNYNKVNSLTDFNTLYH